MESCPDCERSRCFSCIGGKCVALTDNDFGHRGCPFFKPFEQARREQKTCFRRLVQRGRVDLIFKYRKGDGKERATDHPLYKMSWISSCTRIRKSRRWSRRCRGIY